MKGLHTGAVCFFQLSVPVSVAPCCHAVAFCYSAPSARPEDFPAGAYAGLPFQHFLSYLVKNTLKQLEASAALPDLHHPISSVQQASLKLQSVLAVFSPSCLPSTNLLKPFCQSHSELSGFKSSGWCLPSPP